MMEQPSHSQSDSSITSIATKIFGGLVAAVIIGGVLYLVYLKSGLDSSYNRQNAYDNCRATILANVAAPDKVRFMNTAKNTETYPNRDGYTMKMVMQIDDNGQKRTISYNCDVATNQNWFAKMWHDFLG